MDEQLRQIPAGKITAIPSKPMIANGTAVSAMAHPVPAVQKVYARALGKLLAETKDH